MNVIIILIDTLREDYSSILDRILYEYGFVKYSNVISPSPWTLPSHVSLFTGTYPAFHGVHETRKRKNPHIKFNLNSNTLYSELASHGYTTYLLSSNPYVSPMFGFDSFDYYYDTYTGKYSMFLCEKEQQLIDSLKLEAQDTIYLTKKLIKNRRYLTLIKAITGTLVWKSGVTKHVWPFDMGAKRTIKVLNKLNLKIEQPFFMFINLMEVHEPYSKNETPEQLIKAFRDNLLKNDLNWDQVATWRKIYPMEVKYISSKLKQIFEIFKEQGVFRDSLVIITSDHGQLLGEYGRIGHGVFLFDELIQVPLFIKYPEYIDRENLMSSKSKYISLVNLKNFILKLVKRSVIKRSCLFSDVVFSESYGIQDPISPLNKYETENLNLLEKYRIATYYQGIKAVFNITNWKFESIYSTNPEALIEEDMLKQIKKGVINFLKSALIPRTIKGLKRNINF
ncbi:sulfatase-like hydrolase/transferase [Thermococcus sp.]